MWRQNPFWETEGSDQSISDNEEDGNHNLAENPTNPFQGRNGKDNVEMPVFLTLEEQFLSPKKLHGRLSDELISDDEENNSPSNFSFVSKADKPQENHSYESTSKNVDEASTWSAVFEETKELMCLHENDSSSSSHFANYAAKKNWKGSGGKAKPKFLFRLHSDKEELSSLSTTRGKNDKPSKVPLALEGLEDFDCGHTEKSMAELLEGLQKSKEKQPDSYQVSYVTSSVRNRNMEHPMAEILDGLLENIGPLEGTFKMNNKIKGKGLNLSSKRNIPSLGCRTLDTGEPFEPLDSSTSSEEEVVNFLNSGCKTLLKPATSKAEGPMMADRFHKALDAAAVNDHRTPFATSRQTGTGFYGRLQQVIQSEKERQLEFVKRSQQSGRTREDVASHVDVKILSRYLDAKLTVCQCSFGDTIKTIIFSSKIFDNVDLEVGSLVRVHPPWKEVEILGKKESIVLCTYFSQISI